MDKNHDERIPVTIITGFLGAGKTTFLNKIINKNKGQTIAIIENEFGEVAIDNELVVKVEDGIFELTNGCICCSLNDDLIPILNKLIKSTKKIDHLLIETTGIADPGPVALSFLKDSEVRAVFRLDNIITLADAQFIEQQLEDHEDACKQVALADIILLNKVDKIENYQLDTARNILKRMNPLAYIIETNYGDIEGKNILSKDSFNSHGLFKTKFEKDYQENEGTAIRPSSFNKNFESSLFIKRQHHSDIRSQSFRFQECLDPIKFDIWIRLTLNTPDPLIYRVKGILQFKSLEDKIIFQGVNNQFVSERGGQWGKEERESKIVFIGKGLNRDLLEKGLKACYATGYFSPESFYKELNLPQN